MTPPRGSPPSRNHWKPTFTLKRVRSVAKIRNGRTIGQFLESGIVHVTNSGNCTWYEFAAEIVRRSGLPAAVKPVTTAEFPRPARRPAYSVLSPDSLHAYNIHMPEWQDALRRYLASSPIAATVAI